MTESEGVAEVPQNAIIAAASALTAAGLAVAQGYRWLRDRRAEDRKTQRAVEVENDKVLWERLAEDRERQAQTNRELAAQIVTLNARLDGLRAEHTECEVRCAQLSTRLEIFEAFARARGWDVPTGSPSQLHRAMGAAPGATGGAA